MSKQYKSIQHSLEMASKFLHPPKTLGVFTPQKNSTGSPMSLAAIKNTQKPPLVDLHLNLGCHQKVQDLVLHLSMNSENVAFAIVLGWHSFRVEAKAY